MKTTCCIIGQRPQELLWGFNENDPGCVELKRLLEKQIIHMIKAYGVRKFITGVDRGSETYAAEILVELKKHYPITFWCALANEDMRQFWLEEESDRFYNILMQSDGEYLLEGHATENSVANRNRFMVSKSCYALIISDGQPGDASEAYVHAYKNHKNVLKVNPVHYQASPMLTLVK